MTRIRAVSLAALVVLATVLAGVAVTPAAATGGVQSTDEIFAESVTTDMGFGGWSPSEAVIRYGANDQPGWLVKYDSGHAGDLEAWANASTDRRILSRHNDSNIMLISAPKEDVGLGMFDVGTNRLRDLSYVEKIGVNRRVSTDPVTPSELRDKDAWSAPSGSWMATLGGYAGSFEADGAAWSSEVNKSSLQEAREDVGADRVSVNGSGQRVAVLDTGLVYNSSKYGDRVVAAYNALTDTEVNISDPSNVTKSDLEPVYDGSDSKHGSWVTTAIAGNGSGPNGTGVAPGAEIVPVKVLGDDGSGSTDAIARGLEYACGKANVDVVSMSLGSPVSSMVIEEEISECLEEEGVSAVVVAAGNNRMTYRYVASPGDSEHSVITVAADDGKTANSSESAYFSAVGPDPETGVSPDVSAPGMSITAGVGDGERTLSGTSMATPLVSGVILLTLDAKPSLVGQPTELKLYLEEHANPLPEAGVTEVGHGRVSAYNTVNDVVPNRTQKEARNAEAEARDEGNRAHAGSFWRELLG